MQLTCLRPGSKSVAMLECENETFLLQALSFAEAPDHSISLVAAVITMCLSGAPAV